MQVWIGIRCKQCTDKTFRHYRIFHSVVNHIRLHFEHFAVTSDTFWCAFRYASVPETLAWHEQKVYDGLRK